MMQQQVLPAQVVTALGLLAAAGFEAYLVGGCVRDALCGLAPTDFDLATDARPAQMQEVFVAYPCIETGLAHGTLTVVLDALPLEITSYRLEGPYSDGRRPDYVRFGAGLYEDLARRDFTMNALAFHPQRGLKDPFGGAQDLQAGLLRAVGEPAARFREDALRILRCLRFAALRGFSIAEETASAMQECAPLLQASAVERCREEFLRLLAGNWAAQVLWDWRPVLAHALPELGREGLAAFCGLRLPQGEQVWLRLPLLLATLSLDAAQAEALLQRLRLPKREIARNLRLLRLRDEPISCDRALLRRHLAQLGCEELCDLLRFRSILASLEPCADKKEIRDYDEIVDAVQALYEREGVLNLRTLAIGGAQLADFGCQGPAIGACLQLLLEALWEGRVENETEALLRLAQTLNKNKL